MSGLAFSSMRVGESYRLVNYDEIYEFTLIEVTNNNDYLLKDLITLDQYKMSDLTKFGKGRDFELRKIN